MVRRTHQHQSPPERRDSGGQIHNLSCLHNRDEPAPPCTLCHCYLYCYCHCYFEGFWNLARSKKKSYAAVPNRLNSRCSPDIQVEHEDFMNKKRWPMSSISKNGLAA